MGGIFYELATVDAHLEFNRFELILWFTKHSHSKQVLDDNGSDPSSVPTLRMSGNIQISSLSPSQFIEEVMFVMPNSAIHVPVRTLPLSSYLKLHLTTVSRVYCLCRCNGANCEAFYLYVYILQVFDTWNPLWIVDRSEKNVYSSWFCALVQVHPHNM